MPTATAVRACTRKAPATTRPPRQYNTHAELCRQWSATIRALRQAAKDVNRLAQVFCDTLDKESLACVNEPTLSELEYDALPAIEWQLRHAIQTVENNTPAAVELLLGRLEHREGDDGHRMLKTEYLRDLARRQLGEKVA